MTQPSPTEPVAIIGMGCLFPGARNLEAYWASILGKVDAIGDIPPTHWAVADYYHADPKSPDRTYAQRGAFLAPEPFPPLDFGITPNALEATDSTQLLGLLVARRALTNAGYGAGGKAFDRERASVILGVTGTLPLVIPLAGRLGHPHWRRALQEAGVADDVIAEVMQRISGSYVDWQEDSFPGLLGNVVAGRIANRLDLHGTNCVVDAACASSLSAVHLALLELTSGRSDLVLTGGMDTFNDVFMYLCFSKTPALSPTGDARPFASSADGTILGEGLGCLVLKRLADAERDGDHIHAVIRAIGTSSDGKGHAIYAPSAAGQVRALHNAHELAGITPDTIELVEAHGTGTKAGDRAEVQALLEVFAPSSVPRSGKPKAHAHTVPWCALGSVKSQIGHTKAAAGAAGLIKAVLALEHKVLPPTIKVEEPLDLLQAEAVPLYVNTEPRPWLSRPDHPRRAGVSSFGFGGSNYHCVLEEYRPEKSTITWDGLIHLVAFSGSRWDEVARQALTWLDQTPDDWRAAAQVTRAAFDSTHSERLVLVLHPSTRIERVRQAVDELSRHSGPGFWSSPEGVQRGSGRVAGKLALLFPGQGSQYPGMLRDLACCFPQMLETLAEGEQPNPPTPWVGEPAALAAGFRHPAANAAGSPANPAANAAGSPIQGWGAASLSDFIYPHSLFTDAQRRSASDQLRATQIAQPALGAVSLGALRVLEHFGVRPDVVAGHSFGELTALCAAGRLDRTAFHQLAALRGRLMAEQAGEPGGMLAVGLGAEQALAFLQQHALDLVLANHNAPQQSVLSGKLTEINRAAALVPKQGCFCQRLPVSGAFHSPLVAGVREAFQTALDSVEFHPGTIPVHANVTAESYPADAAQARALLAAQLAKPVRFAELITNLFAAGVNTFVEVGPGTVLTGLVHTNLIGRPHQALALDASRGQQPGQLDLARLLAALAALGHSIELTRWDENFVPSPRPQTLTVPICGATYRNPARRPSANGTDARPPRTASPAEPSRPDGLLPVPAPLAPPMPTERPHASSSPATLQFAQESLLALQRLSEQTAQLHRQFLEGQDRALQVFQTLLQQQSALPSQPALASVLTLGRNGHAAPENGRHAPATVEPPRSAARIPAPPPAPAAPPTITRPAAAPAPGMSHLLLAVVAEKTGYPVEMLDLGMELDADLGIDSIKRVEIFSALQEKLPTAPAIKAEQMGTLRTLRDVLDFLGGAAALPAHTLVGVNGTAPAPLRSATADLQSLLLAVVAEKTGYPAEMLEPAMELDADLGIDSIKRVEIFSALQEKLPHAPAIKAEQMGTLRTLRDILDFLVAPAQDAPLAPGGRGVGGEGIQSPALLLEVIAEKSGIDLDALEMSLELDVPANIDARQWREIQEELRARQPGLSLVPAERLAEAPSLRAVLELLGVAASAASPLASAPGESRGDKPGAALPGLTPAGSPPPAVAFERVLSVETCPILEAHVINGRAVLPLALAADWLAQAALHANPGLQLLGLEELRICQGIKLDSGAALPLQLLAGKATRDGDGFRVTVELRQRGTLHASASALLGTKLPVAPAPLDPVALSPYWRDLAEVYEGILFHGQALQGLNAIEGCGPGGIVAQAQAAPPPAHWLREPLRSSWLLDPLVLDCCLQLLSLWSYEQGGAVALPAFIASCRLYRRWPRDGVQIAATITQRSEQQFTADLDVRDTAGQLIARLGGCTSVADRSLNEAFRRNRLAPAS